MRRQGGAKGTAEDAQSALPTAPLHESIRGERGGVDQAIHLTETLGERLGMVSHRLIQAVENIARRIGPQASSVKRPNGSIFVKAIGRGAARVDRNSSQTMPPQLAVGLDRPLLCADARILFASDADNTSSVRMVERNFAALIKPM